MSDENLKTLIGDDGEIHTGSLGATEYTGDGTGTIASLSGASASGVGRIFCIITAKASSGSIFPSGLAVGEMFPALGTETPATGDKFKVLSLTQQADCAGWSMQITQDKVEVTKLKDGFKKYRPGKKDASGSISSIFTQGVSDESSGVVGRTMKLFKRDASGAITVSDAANNALYFIGYTNKAKTAGERHDYVFAKIYMWGVTLGGDTGNAQSFDSEFSLVDIDPIFYNDEVAAA